MRDSSWVAEGSLGDCPAFGKCFRAVWKVLWVCLEVVCDGLGMVVVEYLGGLPTKQPGQEGATNGWGGAWESDVNTNLRNKIVQSSS